MTKKIKNIIPIILVIIFLSSMTIKLVDELFHHHVKFICTAKNEKHFHEKHEKCAIQNFELSVFSTGKEIQTVQNHFYNIQLVEKYVFIYCCNKSKYSFFLRAPPILHSN